MATSHDRHVPRGLRRTIEDERFAVGRVLDDDEWSKLPVTEMARLVCVSVAVVLQVMESRGMDTSAHGGSRHGPNAGTYFFRGVDGGNIKIGWSESIGHRLKAIQRMSPVTLECVGYFPANRAMESDLHYRFRDSRSHGEWFSPTPELLDFISQEATPWQ